LPNLADADHGNDMRIHLLILALFAGLLFEQMAGSACAQESPLVPPWGRDLDEVDPAAEQGHKESAPAHRDESEQRRPWRFTADYWLGWTKNDRIPVLLTTGPTDDPRAGALGREFTRIFYGDAVDFEERHGGRFTLEVPLGATGDWSLAAGYLFLDSRTVGPRELSPGSPILARPFFNVVDKQEDSSLVTYPGLAGGSIAIRSDSLLQGAEANLLRAVRREEHSFVALLVGLRYLKLDENVTITEAARLSNRAPKFPGSNVSVYDRFGADNDFFGGQIGGHFELTYHRWTLAVTSKVALGNVHESILIRGRTTIDTAPATDEPAGLFALATNSGRFSRNTFAVVPEVSGKIGFRVSERLSVFGGYTILYWNRIARPGEQIDRNLNPNLIPTSTKFGGPADPPQPATLFRTNDYWAQGMTWGVEFRY